MVLNMVTPPPHVTDLCIEPGKCSFLAGHIATPQYRDSISKEKGRVRRGWVVSCLCHSWDNPGRLHEGNGPQQIR